jgi:hypothetical protein
MTDVAAAAQFLAGHARLLERRRFAALTGTGRPEDVLIALKAYRNPDGGMGCLEPDIRTPASQPSAALYAFDVQQELGATDPELIAGILDWCRAVANDDGGVPFVLPTAQGWPHAPWFQPSDDPPSSLLMTSGLAAMAQRYAPEHPWLEQAAALVWERLDEANDPYTLRYALDFLDAAPDRDRAEAALDRLGARIPPDGLMRVAAGTEGEVLRPLEVVRHPGHAARRLYDDAVVEAELDLLAAGQQDDGGWTFSWSAWNPAAELEWRGVVTLDALHTLRAYGRLDDAALRISPTPGSAAPALPS